MLDAALRPLKDNALAGPARAMAPINPHLLTMGALLASLVAAVSAWQGSVVVSVAFWLLGRLLDGLDGLVARLRSVATDLGGYLDMLGDTVAYAAIPLGVALGVDARPVWIAVAFLLGSFYINTISWTYLSAVLEKRGRGAAYAGESTSITMPPALIEGTETIVFFTLFLALPDQAAWLFGIMAAAVAVNVVQRLVWARGAL